DIVGARKAGRISSKMAAYRFFVAFVMPAMALGLVARGRPWKDENELKEDLFNYMISAVPLAGPAISKAVKGWNSGSFLDDTAWDELQKLAREIHGKKDRITGKRTRSAAGIAKRTATTVGSLTGKLPHQAVLTAEGAHALATGETDDPRRLIWSEYALREEDKGTKRRRSSRRSSGRKSR
ncbi:unnamed protein product, partial [marine sediment metagenome]